MDEFYLNLMRENAVEPDKNLGQNFLFDREIIAKIVDAAELKPGEQVLEIGPGLGTLTAEILSRGAKVLAIEYDEILAKNLPQNVAKILREIYHDENSAENLHVENADFLQFDLREISKHDYKIVANIPYNITKPIIEKITHPLVPNLAVLLVQKEVAQKAAARPGKHSVFSLRTQNFADVSLGPVVLRDKFVPAPKVDSEVLILNPFSREDKITKFLDVPNLTFLPTLENSTAYGPFAEKVWRLVSAGFREKRKKLRTSLAPALSRNKDETAKILREKGIDPNLRAQDLSMDDWLHLAKAVYKNPPEKGENREKFS